MKNLLKITLGSIALATLAGCSTYEPAPKPQTKATPVSTASSTTYTPSTTYSPPPPTRSEAEVRLDPEFQAEVLRRVLVDEGIFLPEGFGPEYARIVCEGFLDEVNPMTVLRIAYNNFPEYTTGQHATMIGASVGSHCPEMSYIIEQAGQ